MYLVNLRFIYISNYPVSTERLGYIGELARMKLSRMRRSLRIGQGCTDAGKKLLPIIT